MRDAGARRLAWIAALAANASLIAFGTVQSQEPPRQAQEPPTEQQTHRLRERQDNSQQQNIPFAPHVPGVIVAEPPDSGDDQDVAQVKSKPNQGEWFSRFPYDIRVTDILVVMFTGLPFFYTRRLWGSANAANKLALDNMNASRRAWIAIESVKLKHPTAFTDEGAVFSIDVVVRNLGKTPATSVDIRMESYFLAGSGEKFPDAEKRFKSMLRRHPVELGHLLFPKDVFRQGVTWADDGEKIKKDIRTLQSGERTIGFNVFIGASYRIVGDGSAHITYHAYEMLNVPIGTVVPTAKSIDLPRVPFLAGEAD